MGRRSWLVCLSAIVLVAALAAVAWRTVTGDDASLTSSSSASGGDASLAAEADGEYWRSDGETTGAWLQRSWSSPTQVRRVVAIGDGSEPGATAGYLRFSDGSRLHVQLDEGDTDVSITPRTVTWMRFTVTETADGATDVALDQLDADGDQGVGGAVESAGDDRSGDAAPTATLEGRLEPLVDDDPETTARVSDVVELSWDSPKELSRVSIAGAPGGPALAAGLLEFSDGSQVPVGGVLADARRPTTVAFMPRSTTSLRLVLAGDDGEATAPAALLSSFAAFEVGAAPVEPPGSLDPADDGTADSTTASACPEAAPVAAETPDLRVLCPTNGSVVGESVDVSVAVAPSYGRVRAEVWQGGDTVSSSTARVAVDGRADLTVDASEVPPGPFVVALTPRGGAGDGPTTHLQLVRPGQPESDAEELAGRTVVFEDDFSRGVSASRDPRDGEYLAAKPEVWGSNDFGSAIFADPAEGLGNIATSDGYLTLSVQPRPEDLDDFMGWGREFVGGILASARPGGSGFSAQYGYFEARMMAPAEPGTWPAFWTLSNPSLAGPRPVSSEIDAVELYGHDPQGACHTSHEYAGDGSAVEGAGEAICDRIWQSTPEALDWHTYGVDVRPDRIVYYVDGEVVASTDPVGDPEDTQFFLVNLSLGGGWPIDLDAVQGRAALYIDWVRVAV